MQTGRYNLMLKKIHDLIISPQNIIEVNEGNVFHAMKSTESTFKGFGEAYFSTVKPLAIKSWKRHNNMTLNLIVIFGEILFVIYDNRPNSISFGSTQEVILGPSINYARMTVPPGLWVAFQGLSTSNSIMLNLADILHDPLEIDRLEINHFPYEWRK